MQKKRKPNLITDDPAKKEARNIKNETLFTDKERKRKEAKFHTVGGV